MPDDPQVELQRRKKLHANTLRGSSLYHGEPRQTDIRGNIPWERSDDLYRKEKQQLNRYSKPLRRKREEK
jgi:hypothetical protein